MTEKPEAATKRRIGRLGLLRLLARSFYFQSGWNYETLQAAGFAYIIFPVGRRLSLMKGVSRDFAERHVALFNTNPVLASYIIGAVARMEEDAASGLRTAGEIEAAKSYLSVPLAAAGDRFFWATLRPFSGMVGVIVAGVAGWTGALVMLGLYNIFHLYYRVKGVFRGYALGPDVAVEVSKLRLVRLSGRVGLLAAFLLGVFIVAAGVCWSHGSFERTFAVCSAVAVVTGVLPEAFQKRITEIALAVAAAGFILTAGGILG